MIDKYSERGIILELETEMNKKSVLESMDQRGKRKNPLVYFRNRKGKKNKRFGILEYEAFTHRNCSNSNSCSNLE